MFHVEHPSQTEHTAFRGSRSHGPERPLGETILVMETKKKNRADNDGREQNLTDVIVQDFLIGTGSVAGTFFPFGNFLREDRAGWRGYVLFYVHVLTPLVAIQSFPCVCNFVFWGVPLFPGARVFITKVPPYYNCFLQLFADYFRLLAGTFRGYPRGVPLSSGCLDVKYSSS
jgi:hypothetical protein